MFHVRFLSAAALLASAFALSGAAPAVTTQSALQAGVANAVIRGSVNPFNQATVAWFEWGTTTNYGNTTAPTNLPSAFTFFPVSTQLYELMPDTTYHYRVVATNSDGATRGADAVFSTLPAPVFAEISNSFRGAYNGMQAFADYDADGRMDLLLAGSTNFLNNASVFTFLYRNTGSSFVEVYPGHPGLGQGSIAWADWDRDGHLDYFITGRQSNSASYSQLTLNNGNGTFNFGVSFLPAAQDTTAAWGDFDRDGEPDLFVAGESGGNQFIARLYENNTTAFGLNSNSFRPVQNGDAAWGDYDSDGDLDLVIAGDNRNAPLNNSNLLAHIYRNDAGTFVNSGIVLPGLASATVAWLDCDNDGDLDLFLTGATNTTGDVPTNYVALLYRNHAGIFTNMNLVFPDATPRSFVWGDFDNDGSSDILLTGLGNNSLLSGLFLGSSNGNFTAVTNSGLARINGGRGAIADVDNDGRLDVLLTGVTNPAAGVTRLFRNLAAETNTPPTSPTNLTVEIASDGRSAILRWSAATDAQTPSLGLTYNVRMGNGASSINVISPESDLARGRRLLPAMGNAQHRRRLRINGLVPGERYYWSVQAVDNGFAASAFASEADFYAIGPANLVSASRNGDDIVIIGRGTPGILYNLEGANDLVQPPASIQWTDVGFDVADGNGFVQFTVSRNAVTNRFFRTVYSRVF